MIYLIFIVLSAVIPTAFSADLPTNRGNITKNLSILQQFKRSFPAIEKVKTDNSPCLISSNTYGICSSINECSARGGTAAAMCSNGNDVCCLLQNSCGSYINVNNTYFVNPLYPRTYDGGNRCSIFIMKSNPNICQLRLEFVEFSLAQPTAEGICDYDGLSVTGGSSSVPRICGENTDQHVYVNFENSNLITVSIDASTLYAAKRRWNILVQQIPCDSQWRAPSGCLQYYTNPVADTVRSFNYGETYNHNPRLSRYQRVGTREIANLNYGVCVKKAPGCCELEWSATHANSFAISGYTYRNVDGPITEAPAKCESYGFGSGSACRNDFIVIPNPYQYRAAANSDRFCGSAFKPKTTQLSPFVLYVVTDNVETMGPCPDTGNRGFSLSYYQKICFT